VKRPGRFEVALFRASAVPRGLRDPGILASWILASWIRLAERGAPGATQRAREFLEF
jgi:hypothetical protein